MKGSFLNSKLSREWEGDVLLLEGVARTLIEKLAVKL